ncbi:Rha family transcriptional regulator, partial [Paenibacillus campi]|uniref:Rha family transcriptional regulator n=1 Tax=Paenibacillus campi TaxID=3106031 RepID=UPI002AFE7447
MNQLVYAHEGRLVTDSLRVAEETGKLHKNVLRDIRNLEVSEEFNRLNFEPVKYRDKKNQERDKFLITEHGLNFLAMTYSPA